MGISGSLNFLVRGEVGIDGAGGTEREGLASDGFSAGTRVMNLLELKGGGNESRCIGRWRNGRSDSDFY